jgi:hypothetical protein
LTAAARNTAKVCSHPEYISALGWSEQSRPRGDKLRASGRQDFDAVFDPLFTPARSYSAANPSLPFRNLPAPVQ